jgi:cohesin domain-containing protein
MKVRSLIIIVVASLALMLVGITSAQETSARVWLSSETQQAAAGQEFTVTINVADAVGVYGGSFKLAYDPQALEVVLAENKAVVPGTFFNTGSTFTLVNTANAGTIEYAMTLTQPAEPVTGGGALGTITFRALTGGAVNITPTEVRLLSPEFTEVDGRKIAQKIDEVATQIEGMTINAGSTSNVEASIVQPPEPTPELRPLTVPESTPVTMSGPMSRPVLVIGTILFVIGLLLFATSIGVYVNLRRQFYLQEQSEQLIW